MSLLDTLQRESEQETEVKDADVEASDASLEQDDKAEKKAPLKLENAASEISLTV